jgi:hypothetical protein
MLRGAPPAAGPTGTLGRARATPELHGAVQRGTVGRGLNRDHRPCTGRGSYASTHAHLGTAGRETILGITRAVGGPEELLDSEREATRRRMHISAPPAAGPARGPWAAGGPEELRDSEWSHGCRRDAVTVCFQYLVPQVTVSDDSTTFFCIGCAPFRIGRCDSNPTV